jgi:hypothetical protein
MLAEPPSINSADVARLVNGERKKELRKLAAAKQPRKETSHGMLYSFQVLYRSEETVKEIFIFAETAGEARWLAEQCGVTVSAIGPGRPQIPEREILNGRDEISAFLGIEPGTLSDWMTHGIIKQTKEGDVKATRSALVALITKIGLRDPNPTDD